MISMCSIRISTMKKHGKLMTMMMKMITMMTNLMNFLFQRQNSQILMMNQTSSLISAQTDNTILFQRKNPRILSYRNLGNIGSQNLTDKRRVFNTFIQKN
ncbi:putative ORFan [Cotonvirus japonicus]|uniref:ORFan n=1 Tax=Cotonvirus japonicus TaxID=2811091 RepID=A0ABM7NR93_9VIRU|nr:putative ORFan [Cotonvirus japonicus]BCS82688.1 putative ORFan [Cotonvirus japonicus]